MEEINKIVTPSTKLKRLHPLSKPYSLALHVPFFETKAMILIIWRAA